MERGGDCCVVPRADRETNCDSENQTLPLGSSAPLTEGQGDLPYFSSVPHAVCILHHVGDAAMARTLRYPGILPMSSPFLSTPILREKRLLVPLPPVWITGAGKEWQTLQCLTRLAGRAGLARIRTGLCARGYSDLHLLAVYLVLSQLKLDAPLHTLLPLGTR